MNFINSITLITINIILFLILCGAELSSTRRSIISPSSRFLPTNQQRGISTRDAELYKKHHHSTTPAPHIPKSPKCMIHYLADFNHIEISFRFVTQHGPAQNRTFVYQLTLGNEQYQAEAVSKKKAQIKVSEEALNNTKYKHPPNSARACMITQSPINVVQEWAQKRKLPVVYFVKEQKMGPPKEYTIQCVLGTNLTTQADGSDKKHAKLKAAEKMLETLKNLNIPIEDEVKDIFKYNDTKSVKMHPVSRLNEIQLARHDLEPIYKVKEDVILYNDMGHKVKFFVMEVKVGNQMAMGKGQTLKKAKLDASRNMLKKMGFTI